MWPRWLYRPTMMEAIAFLATVAATIYFLHSNGYGWRAFVFATAMLLFGYIAGGMVHDLWFGGRR